MTWTNSLAKIAIEDIKHWLESTDLEFVYKMAILAFSKVAVTWVFLFWSELEFAKHAFILHRAGRTLILTGL